MKEICFGTKLSAYIKTSTSVSGAKSPPGFKGQGMMVQEGGLEPPSSFKGWLLRPVRLPVSPLLHYMNYSMSVDELQFGRGYLAVLRYILLRKKLRMSRWQQKKNMLADHSLPSLSFDIFCCAKYTR